MAQTQTWTSPAKPEERNQLPLVFSPCLLWGEIPSRNGLEEAAAACGSLAGQGLFGWSSTLKYPAAVAEGRPLTLGRVLWDPINLWDPFPAFSSLFEGAGCYQTCHHPPECRGADPPCPEAWAHCRKTETSPSGHRCSQCLFACESG